MARTIVSVLFVLVAGVTALTRSGSDVPPPASITIVHFNDVYEIDAVENGASGGLARVATVIDRLKRSGRTVMTTLGGDFLSPSAIGTARVNGERLAGRQMVDILNLIGLQYATLGNHEFDLSERLFKARMAEAKFKTIVANVTDANGQPFEGLVPSLVVPVRANGRLLRIGLVGVVLDANPQPWVRYSPPIDAVRTQVAALRGKTDAIVALTHLSLDEDQRLATAVPEIDVQLGGHEHENWMLRRGPRFTPIIKADANVRSLAIVTLTFGRPGVRPTVAARLEIVDSKVPFHPRVQAAVRKWVATGFEAFKADGLDPAVVVTTIPEPLDGRESTVRNEPGPLTDLITASMLREVKDANLAMLNGGSVRIDDILPAGPVREYDIIRVLPFGSKIVRATMEGALVAKVLDVGQTNRGTGGFLQTANVIRQGSTWVIQGKPLDPAARYVVSLPDFLLTGAEIGLSFLTRDNPQVFDAQEFRDTRRAVIEELKSRYGG